MEFSNIQSNKSKQFIAIIILSLFLHVTFCDIQYINNIKDDFENDLIFEESNSNQDGMILLRFSKRNDNNIYLKIILVSRSILSITVVNKSFLSSKMMNATILNEEYILILYATQNDTFDTFDTFGLVSSWNGDIIDIIDFGIVWDNTRPKSNVPKTNLPFGLFIHEDVFAFAGVRGNDVIWKRFKLPNKSYSNNRNVTLITEGSILNPLSNSTFYPSNVKYFQLIDGGFGIAISYRHGIDKFNVDEVYVNLLEPNATEPLGPYLLHHAFKFKDYKLPILIDDCIINFDGTGYTCTIYDHSESSQIRFLSNGAVTSVGYTNIDVYQYYYGKFFFPNFYGGYVGFVLNNTNNKIDFYDIDHNYEVNTTSTKNKYINSLDNVTHININLIQKQNVFWTLRVFNYYFTIDYFSLNTIDSSDYRYMIQNPNVNNTSPSINETIYLPNDNLQLKIFYNIPIIISTGNLTIYQYDEEDNLSLRQIISGQNFYDDCEVQNDTVLINILPSTFHKGNANFSVRVDNNFVKSRKTQEPLLGISEKIWRFSTQLKEQDQPSDQLILSIKLKFNDEMPGYYDEVNSQNTYIFGQLQNELSKIIPINSQRLEINHIQNLNADRKDQKQVLLSIAVNKPNNYSTERNTESVKKDLDELIKNMDFNLISQGNITRFIDKGYGAQPTRKYINFK
ncbi:9186_t:CDS:2 [Funneliformis mosseae]|uniref:9186_t:CDS:1 n=1 Tax=Funneliformis mosseae TaxID=27381 RepID=A0A9N9FCD6_FUNMO|nr:9186_t:CDS:2 [Funneliformis mosseae]